jgi:hypothetical protein
MSLLQSITYCTIRLTTNHSTVLLPSCPLFLTLESQYSNKGCSSDVNKLPSTRPGDIVRRPSTFLTDSSYSLLLFAVAKGLTEIARVLIKSPESVTELDEVSHVWWNRELMKDIDLLFYTDLLFLWRLILELNPRSIWEIKSWTDMTAKESCWHYFTIMCCFFMSLYRKHC